MERVALTAETREAGKGPAKRMRISGRVPAVLYGKKVAPLGISVDRRELEKAVKTKAGMNVMIDLSIKGGDSGLALIRDFQADPFKRDFVHVDFQAISLTDKIAVEVPVILIGLPVGVKEGGVVEQLRRTIDIKSLPEKIPEKIEVDITEMKIGDSLHANNLKLPEGVEFAHAVNYTIVAIVPPAKEEVAAVAVPAEGAVPVEGAVPTEGAAPAVPGGAVPAVPGGAASAKGSAAPAKGGAPRQAQGAAEKKEGK